MESEREQIECQAAQWVLRAERGLGAEESAALAAWLDASVANRLAYLRLKSGWQRTERLAALRDGDVFADNPETTMRWQAVALAAAVLVLLGIGAGAFWHFHAAAPAVYTTQLGERPILRLPDGTRIQLNTDTQVQTDVTRAARTVTLERGEAFFEVVHDDKRPFVVIAGNRRITDLGTKFSVRRDGDNVKVIVTEGRVRVDILDAPVPSVPVFANEGNIVVAKADETLVFPKSLKDMAGDLSWRNGMLVFDQETLSSVAEQFNRYNRRRILVQGRARDIRIGGSFRADNIDSFVQLIRGSLGLKVIQEEDQITISE